MTTKNVQAEIKCTKAVTSVAIVEAAAGRTRAASVATTVTPAIIIVAVTTATVIVAVFITAAAAAIAIGITSVLVVVVSAIAMITGSGLRLFGGAVAERASTFESATLCVESRLRGRRRRFLIIMKRGPTIAKKERTPFPSPHRPPSRSYRRPPFSVASHASRHRCRQSRRAFAFYPFWTNKNINSQNQVTQ